MSIGIELNFVVHIPELLELGDKIVTSLSVISDALTSLEGALTTELGQIAQALQDAASTGAPDPAELQSIVDRVTALQGRVENIIP